MLLFHQVSKAYVKYLRANQCLAMAAQQIIKSLENNKDKDQEKLLCQVRFNCSIGCGHRLVDISLWGYGYGKEHPIMHHMEIPDTLSQL